MSLSVTMFLNMSAPEMPIELWDPTISPTYRWILKVQTVLEPIIIGLGMLGNILATFVFMSKGLRVTSCCLYLGAKCVGDTIFLTALFIVWLYRVHAPLLNITGVCQVTIFLTYACSYTSVWLIVLVSYENYVRIALPHLVKIYCTPRRATVNICIVYFSATIIYNVHLWTTQVLEDDNNKMLCMALARYHKLLVTINVVDLLATLILPALLVTMLMLATLLAVVQALKRKKRLSESLIGNGRCYCPHSQTIEIKVAKFLTIVALTLIILHSPSHVIRLKMIIASFVCSEQPSHLDYSLQRVFEVMYYLNFSANFIIFITAGEKFRRILLQKILLLFCTPYSSINSMKMKTLISMTCDRKQSVELTVINTTFDDMSSSEEGRIVTL